jgi:hypothetical protein
MSFEKASSFIFMAAKKYNLHKQVASGICLVKVKKILEKNFSDFFEFWEPKKFEHGKLTIAVQNSSASSELFMKTHEILELFETHDFPQKINEISIVRNR